MAKKKNALIEVLREYQRKYISEFGKNIKKYNIHASGKLGKSLKVGRQPKVKLFGSTYAMKIYAEPYWEQVNYGRGPSENSEGNILSSKLEEWLRLPNVRRKVTQGGEHEGGSDKAWTKAKYKSVAFAMAQKIHEEGIPKGRPFIDDARDKLDSQMFKAVTAAAADMVALKMEDLIKYINSN